MAMYWMEITRKAHYKLLRMYNAKFRAGEMTLVAWQAKRDGLFRACQTRYNEIHYNHRDA
jgi:hypothetical protein